VSETMSLRHAPEAMAHHSLWAGRIMSAFVVAVLVADGAIQLFAPAQIASMLRETGFAMDLTRVVGPIILACAILYAIPATAVLGAILVTGFLGGAICAHVRIGELGFLILQKLHSLTFRLTPVHAALQQHRITI